MAESESGIERQSVDIILRGGTVLTMNATRDVLTPGSVAIHGRDIVAVGEVAAIDAAYEAASVIDCADHLVLPGLVNAHTHLPMALLRGLADDLRPTSGCGYIMPVERVREPRVLLPGTQLACAEMLRGGVTVSPTCTTRGGSLGRGAAGMRGICGETVMKLPTPDAPSYEDALRYCADFDHWQGHELIVAPAPHSPTLPPRSCETTELARHTTPQLIHTRTADEVDERCRHPPCAGALVGGAGAVRVTCLAAHCACGTARIRPLANHHVGVSHNPTSNLKLASGIAPGRDARARVRLGIGTDGSASNNDLDMFEMRLAASCPRWYSAVPWWCPPTRPSPCHHPAPGAPPDHLIGSLERKRADVIGGQ